MPSYEYSFFKMTVKSKNSTSKKVLLYLDDMLKDEIYNKLSEIVLDTLPLEGDILELIIKDNPDLIILENSLNINALNLLKLLSENGITSKIPIFIIDDKSSLKIEYLKLGAVDCIEKPFNVDELVLKIKNIINIDCKGNDDKSQHEKKNNILFVDDEKIILSILTSRYKSKGYNVYSTDDGVKALEIINENKIDLVVTDYYMKTMNGDELAKSIKKNHKEIKVILLTSQDNEDFVKKAFEIGADDYVSKPFSPMELDSRIKKLLSE